MKPKGAISSLGLAAEAQSCPQCGSTSRVGGGLCLNCSLYRGLGEETLDSETLESVLEETDIRDADWRLGNYQILEEIGRGGMGVIYRARQRHSRRIVALKRILGHHADSHDTLVRFRREAEAAASLDHPHILPIYEVSESEDGLPFFSMKFAAGGSLLGSETGLRENLPQAVTLMAKVSRAVEYAHSRGILHRDLKPGNILLDARGEPMVSDFGLAKWLDDSSDLTRTLTVFGTPGYIAPEQAHGPAAGLKPTADIYSLGAVLFDLLAGRPPFLGEHALSVIEQAKEKPAPKLRSIIPKVDRDLETICARCLEREPNLRYHSAGDLAEDLERWLDGRPVIARPVSPPVRVWRWARRNPKLATSVAGCVIGGIIALTFVTFTFLPDTSPFRARIAIPEKSIAVLPFENRSEDKANSYFADGIQDEILTRLAQASDLKVISRTSTQHYKSLPENVRETARQLGVAHLLEGSIQKIGDAVRVNVRLIHAGTNSQIWAETFDRKLTDVFSVESDVARAVANQLQIRLSGSERQAIGSKPTSNPDAYDAYLRGIAFTLKTTSTTANALGAQKYFKEAVRLDPNFSTAWAQLAIVDARNYLTQSLRPTLALKEEARQAAQTALNLQPSLGEALWANGYYYYACLKDFETATRYLEQARKQLPNNSGIPETLAYVERRRGNWKQSEEYLEQAEQLDPRNVALLTGQATNFICLRRFGEAKRKLDVVLQITGDDMVTLATQAAIAQAEGDLTRSATLLAPLRPNTYQAGTIELQTYQAILERRPLSMVSRVKELLAFSDPSLVYTNADLKIWLGWAQQLAGDAIGARQTFQKAHAELEPLLADQSEDYSVLVDLAMVNMALGNKNKAINFAERAIAADPVEKDAVRSPMLLEYLARVCAQMGEPERAVELLGKLLSMPYEGTMGTRVPLTPALLRLDPMFDPLRNRPDFQKLVSQSMPH